MSLYILEYMWSDILKRPKILINQHKHLYKIASVLSVFFYKKKNIDV